MTHFSARLLYVFLLLFSVQSSLAQLEKRTVFFNNVQTMEAWKKLKMDDKPFLIGPGGGFKEEDLNTLEDRFGAQYLGTFKVKSKFGRQAPVGTVLNHHVVNFPRTADVQGGCKFMMQNSINFIFDLRVPKGETVSVSYPPEQNPEAYREFEKKDVRWIKLEDQVASVADVFGPTDASLAYLEGDTVKMSVITSNYAPPGWISEHASQVLGRVTELGSSGWYLLGYSRERILLYSPAPEARNSRWTLFGGDGGLSQWRSNGEDALRIVKGDIPLYGPERVPFTDVHYQRRG